jgi:riboflavin kinase/FMN adenylyltransferase
MEIIKSLDKIKDISHSAVTIGNFDGVHKGHQVLINKTVKAAKENGVKSVVFTFENHPVNFFKPDAVKNIISNEDKLKIFESMDVDVAVIVPFDHYMTTVDPTAFVEDILVDKLHAKFIIIGHDFSFAKEKLGNSKFLQSVQDKYKFDVEIVEPVMIRGKRISSTYIRELVSSGRVEEIKEYLGRNYKISGEVIHSKKLGRTFGFPTANISLDKGMLTPDIGIYASIVNIDKELYFGATNVGYNPTVNGQNLSLETNIIDFDKDIYGKVIEVEFLEKIRDEIKFDGIEGLKNQLAKDVDYVKRNYVCKIK